MEEEEDEDEPSQKSTNAINKNSEVRKYLISLKRTLLKEK